MVSIDDVIDDDGRSHSRILLVEFICWLLVWLNPLLILPVNKWISMSKNGIIGTQTTMAAGAIMALLVVVLPSHLIDFQTY